jgi:hypothetical protein
MGRSPSWKAYSSSGSQETPGILRNFIVNCSGHKQLALALILSHINRHLTLAEDSTSTSILFKPIATRIYSEVTVRFNTNDP